MNYIVIVAGGKGMRMGADIPKQFIPIGGKPVLMHTLERFFACDGELKIILVLPHEQQAYWRQLCRDCAFNIPHTIVDGGETRFESSRKGLQAIPLDATGLVGIHDGVRPFVSEAVIKRCFEAADESKAAIPVLPVTDTLRHVDRNGVGRNVLRSDYRIVQTPQVFDIRLLRKAFEQPYQDSFTDEASVVESLGYTVEMVEGNRENIKLTTPFDLTLAEAMLKP
ncbi:2-C-methyl-D-erythritol 4-phosphate cytidylyltransferase [Hoylesella enoeca]|uniref:2-C-methyl-D-erythritol 4-phosphate cytidylyltransferase n=1 Tax=Hoylesella enoeca TaxID=76123 RepID=UPI00288A6E07|nr:2-C-methyl-D-erythritol 4-phosphate cytidylyltransferase [Hoylesella enoeca]